MTKCLSIGAMIVLPVCSTPHWFVLLDGSEFETLDQPSYNRTTGFYEFEAVYGKEIAINKDQVKVLMNSNSK